MLYSTEGSIRRVDMASSDVVTIETGGRATANAIDYDYANHCIFYALSNEKSIKVSLLAV